LKYTALQEKWRKIPNTLTLTHLIELKSEHPSDQFNQSSKISHITDL